MCIEQKRCSIELASSDVDRLVKPNKKLIRFAINVVPFHCFSPHYEALLFTDQIMNDWWFLEDSKVLPQGCEIMCRTIPLWHIGEFGVLHPVKHMALLGTVARQVLTMKRTSSQLFFFQEHCAKVTE